ncbi:MAG: hypothetical protein H7Z14_13280 [Anaerolineae bacterium]|nr:hypothetical protein [Phycisphaerae bacterium]
MLIEQLESRRLFSTINWMNRGLVTDRFSEVFGAQANLARGVIDEAIARWERVITDFNYSDGTNTYTLLIAMSGTTNGTGGVGGSDDDIDGKPSHGTVVFYRGTDGAGAGWYLDPVPADDVEFNSTVHNAFSARASAGRPFTRADLLTVAMHEIGHALGLDSNDAMNKFATDTGAIDTGSAHLWAFEGPSVSHLFTGYDVGGTHNGAQHSADSDESVFYNGQMWYGTDHLMNPVVATSQRNLIDNVTAWAIHDAWDYDIELPEVFGTFYSTLNRSTGQLLVRGAPGPADPSNDNIQIGLLFGALVVSVDIGQDIPGTGPLPGVGNVDAFASVYNPADITSIIVQSGDGNDTIFINSIPANVTGVSVEGGTGNDTLTLGGGDLDTNLNAPITFTGGSGNADAIIFDDDTDGLGSDTYTLNTNSLVKPAGDSLSWLSTENVTLNASANNDAITVTGTASTTAVRVNSRDGNDTINVQSTDIASPVTLTTGIGTDTVNVNTDDTGIALAIFPGTENVTNINIGIGGRLALGGAGVPNSFVLVTTALSIDNGGALDLTNNSMIVDYGGASPYVTIRDYIATARNGGAWNGSGITSFGAFLANPRNTTLGLLTSVEYFSIYGFGADYLGQNIDLNAIVVKYTYYGDTDFNGVVDFDDYSRADAGFNNNRTGWLNGDVDGNGIVDFDDYSLIDLAFNTQGVALRGQGVGASLVRVGARRISG